MTTIPRISGCFVLVPLVACVSGPPMRPASAPVREVIEESRALVLSAPTSYGAPVAIEAAQAARVKRFREGLSPSVAALATHDPALDGVAAVFAQTVGVTGQAPADAVVDWLCWRFGATSTVRQTLTQIGNGFGAWDGLEEVVAGEAAKVDAKDGRPLSFGLALVAHGNARAVLTVVVAARLVTLAPLEKVQEPGTTVRLQGKSLIAARSGRVFVDTGKVPREVEVAFAEDGAFSVDVTLPTEPGRWFVELVAEDAKQQAKAGHGWSEAFALLPFHVGVPEPTEPEAAIRTPVPNPADRAAWTDAMLAIVNGARESAGSPPLERDALLEKLVAKETRSHVLDPDAAPDANHQETLARQGFPASKIDVHVGSLEFVDEATRRLLWSPRNRRSLLDPARRRIGVAFEGTFNGATPYGVLLYTPAPHPPDADASEAMFAAMNAERLRRRKLPVLRDAELMEGTLALARRVCSGELDAQTLEVGKYLRLKRSFEDAQARSFFSVHFGPEDVDALEETLDGVWTHGGAATCRGKVAKYPDGQYVLFLFLR